MTNVNTAQAIPQNNGLMNFGMPGSTGLPSFDTTFPNLGLPAITQGGTDSLQTQQPTTVNNLTAGAPSAMNYSFTNNALAGLNSALLGSSLDMMPSPGLLGYSPYSMSMNPYMMAMGTEYMDKMLDYQKRGAAMNVELNKYNVAANNQIRTAQAGADMDFARSQMYARDNFNNEANTMGNAGLQTKIEAGARDLMRHIGDKSFSKAIDDIENAKDEYREHIKAQIMNNPNLNSEQKKAKIAAELSETNVDKQTMRLLAASAGVNSAEGLKATIINEGSGDFESGFKKAFFWNKNNNQLLSKAEVEQRIAGTSIDPHSQDVQLFGKVVGKGTQVAGCMAIGAIAGSIIPGIGTGIGTAVGAAVGTFLSCL